MLCSVYTYKFHYFINDTAPWLSSLGCTVCVALGEMVLKMQKGQEFFPSLENSVFRCICVCFLHLRSDEIERELGHRSPYISLRVLPGAGHLRDLQ